VTSARADSETVLSGGRFAQPVRRGNEVHRTAVRGASNIHPLLDHFATRSCPLTPRVRGTSADRTHEALSWLPNRSRPTDDRARPIRTGTGQRRPRHPHRPRRCRRVHPTTRRQLADRHPRRPGPPELIGHRDLGSWNILFDGPDVVGIIDWDLAGPTTRAFDLAIAAHSFVPLHPTGDLPAWGWPTEPDLAAFAAAYGTDVTAAQILDALLVHLTATAGYQAAHLRDHDPAWAVHADEDHPAGYRAAARYLIDHYDTLTA